MIAHKIILSFLYLFCIAKANSFLQLNGYRCDKNFFAYFKTDFSAFAIVFFAVDVVFFVMFKSAWLYVHVCMVLVLAISLVACGGEKTPDRGCSLRSFSFRRCGFSGNINAGGTLCR